MAKKKKKKDNKAPKQEKAIYNKRALKNHVYGIFSNNPTGVYNYRQLASLLGITDQPSKEMVNQILEEMTREDFLEQQKKGKYKLRSRQGHITGTVDMTNHGYAYVVSEEIPEDIFVSQNNLHQALNGDQVKVYLFATRKKMAQEGEVVEIIKRAKDTFVGTIEMSKKFAFLITDDRKMPYDIFIPLKNLNGAKNGMKAIARITDWPVKAKNPLGKIEETLGYPGNNDTEMHSILASHDLPHKFPGSVEKAAEKINTKIRSEEIKSRRDFREVVTFTIDPADAKDFDDALSLMKLKNGNWEVGIHIADVTHYVETGTTVDKEGFERATSVYLVDRVVPMLPEVLSNNVCSLRPNEDKLCFSAVFEIDGQAEVKNQWFGRTIINSDKRFDYAEAEQCLKTGQGDYANELRQLNELSKILRSRRFRQGSISFERTEMKFELDKEGRPIAVHPREYGESNKLIEEFMLLANKKVAEFIGKKKKEEKPKTFVYRVHDKPDKEKLENFTDIIRKFGHKIDMKNKTVMAQSINRVLDSVVGRGEQNLVETLAIRTMAKAEYTTKNIGHYGLGFEHYTHFTSPIRRYPDMMVHRLLDAYLNGGKSKSANKYEQMCQHCSEMERMALEAERDSIKYMQVLFIQDHVGQAFDGVISGVTEWGIFVEMVDNKCEGMIPLREMNDDWYVYDEENYTIYGRKKGRKFQLGDQVKVEVVGTDLSRKQIDLKVAD